MHQQHQNQLFLWFPPSHDWFPPSHDAQDKDEDDEGDNVEVEFSPFLHDQVRPQLQLVQKLESVLHMLVSNAWAKNMSNLDLNKVTIIPQIYII